MPRHRTTPDLQALAALLDAAPDSILGITPNGRIVFANRQAAAAFGYTDDELTGFGLDALIVERTGGSVRSDDARLDHPLARFMTPGLDLSGRRKDGSEFPVEVRLSPDPNGAMVTAVVRDVTDRRHALRQLRDSERLLRLAQHVARLGSFEVDLTGERVIWSEELYRIYGLEPADPRGGNRDSLQMVHPEDRERVTAVIRTAVTSRTPISFEYRIVRPDGSIRILHSLAEAAVEEGRVRIIGTAEDVTERKHSEERLRESERRLATLLSNLPGMAYRCRNDLSWTIEFVSDGCFDLTGYPPRDLVANHRLSYADLIHPADRDRVWDEVQGALRERLPFRLLYRIHDATGQERWISEQGRGVFSETGEIVALEGFATDVTERQRTVEELALARDEALEASRLKSVFLATISHEIRTPLNVMLGYGALIAEYLDSLGDHSQDALLKASERSGRRLVTTVHQILDYSRIQTGGFEILPTTIELPASLLGVLQEYEALAAEKQLAFRWESTIPPAVIRFDLSCLLGTLQSLLDNAVKFTARGTVSVRLDRDEGGALRLSVSDTGVGIAESYVKRLFEPFNQEKDGLTRPFEGSGIGLALARCYLELNGARISVRSRKDVGSTFTIHFSRVHEPPSTEVVSPEAANPPTRPSAGWPTERIGPIRVTPGARTRPSTDRTRRGRGPART